MRGLEGDADKNQDRSITAKELIAYISDNVPRQAARLGRKQSPQLFGDLNRVIVSW
jgi:hypothetical protein